MSMLRESDREALLKLLADDDATVLRLLGEQFTDMGADGRAFLELVAGGTAAEAKRGARRILRTLREQEAQEAFARFCATAGSPSSERGRGGGRAGASSISMDLDSGGMLWKVGLILAAFALLFVIRALGGGKPDLGPARRRRSRTRPRPPPES